MIEEYSKPEFEVVLIDGNDVITCSNELPIVPGIE